MMLLGISGSKCPKDTVMKNSISDSFHQAKVELSKVIFPTKPQVKQAFVAVMVVVTFVVLFLALADFLLSSTVSAILN
jgi:preprotein translocase subunit SecE